jgi:hypothetical protein
VKLIQERRDLIKVVAGIVVILAFVALAALAIAASRSDLSISAPGVSRPAAASTPTGDDAGAGLAVPPPAEQPAATAAGGGSGAATGVGGTAPAEGGTPPATEAPTSPARTPAKTARAAGPREITCRARSSLGRMAIHDLSSQTDDPPR